MNAPLLHAHFQQGDFVIEAFHGAYLASAAPTAAVVVLGNSDAVR
jgi:hypothetical protein